ncbi:flavin reductase [Streptococcus pseudoporcinus]|uniref:Flavin reductase n=1 Tax=Streptococcus pseudoporcinus TaxID=361101 RepID=A0A4U9ZF93_9STRE|nr:flavin reductase [Streptococcus pseudoporcinus]
MVDMQLFAIYNDLIPFIRTIVAGEFTKTTVNPEAWGTGVLEISEETKASLASQAEALLAAVSND